MLSEHCLCSERNKKGVGIREENDNVHDGNADLCGKLRDKSRTLENIGNILPVSDRILNIKEPCTSVRHVKPRRNGVSYISRKDRQRGLRNRIVALLAIERPRFVTVLRQR